MEIALENARLTIRVYHFRSIPIGIDRDTPWY
jgi:hypothetical protein